MSRWWLFLLLVPAVVEMWFAFVLFGWYDALNRRDERLYTKVEALRDYERIEGDGVDALIWRSDVLALLDGRSE